MTIETMLTGWLASSGTDQSSADMLWLLGPVAGAAFYVLTFLRYRNITKRHAYERETTSTVTNVTDHDHKVGQINDVEHSTIRGMNSDSPRTRLGVASSWVEQ